jgi:hypothetical protein
MSLHELHSKDYVTIYHDDGEEWLYVDWVGYQTVDSVKAGCLRMLELMVEHRVFAILNDNTRVTGTWAGAAEWGASEWFPAMRRAGMKSFAWVYGPSLASQDSTDATLSPMAPEEMGIRVFYNINYAREWLRYRRNAPLIPTPNTPIPQ